MKAELYTFQNVAAPVPPIKKLTVSLSMKARKFAEDRESL
jgi:hypothetical protein